MVRKQKFTLFEKGLKMRERDKEYLRKKLLEKHAEIMKQVKYYEEHHFKTSLKDKSGELTSYATHPADQVLSELEHENAYFLASKARETLYAIEEALARMKDGTYGICMICEKEIDVERLKAVPWTELCIDCQKKLETQKKEGERENI